MPEKAKAYLGMRKKDDNSLFSGYLAEFDPDTLKLVRSLKAKSAVY